MCVFIDRAANKCEVGKQLRGAAGEGSAAGSVARSEQSETAPGQLRL
jgi:hypothetical protein